MRKLLLFALSLSLTTPIISKAASTAATDHKAIGFIPKYRRKPTPKLVVPVSNHIHEVHMHQGKVIKLKLYDSKTGKVHFLGFPYGLHALQAAGKAAVVKKHDQASYEKFMAEHLKSLELAKNVTAQIANIPLNPATPLKSARMAAMATLATTASITYPDDCVLNAATTTYTCNMNAGADTTVGLIDGSKCFNFNTMQGTSMVSSSFSQKTAANSLAKQFNASGSISGQYGLFSADASFTLGETYDSSTVTGSMYFDYVNVRQFTNTLDNNYPLNSYGRQQVVSDSFAGSCGNRFISNVYGGMLLVGKLSWSTSSATTSQNVSSNLNASYGLNNISTAVSTAKTSSDASTTLDFSMTYIGGGVAAHAIIDTAMATKTYALSIKNTVSSDKDLCFSGNTLACTSFFSALQTAASKANSAYEASIVNAKTGVLASDLSSVALFPDGVNGTDVSITKPNTSTALSYMNVIDPSTIIADATNAINNTTTYSFTTNSAIIGYKSQIINYIGIINQISTLAKRATSLQTRLSKNTNFNPKNQMNNFDTILGQLNTTYAADRQAMVVNLGACLNTLNTTTAITDCAPILNLYTANNSAITSDITSAWEWYNQSYMALVATIPSTTAPVFSAEIQAVYAQLALQNTIALQYTSYFHAHNPLGSSYAQNNFSYPNDVLWITNLSSPWICLNTNPNYCSLFSVANIYGTPDPQGKPALITFNDFNWTGLLADATGTVLKSWVNLIPMDSSNPSMLTIGNSNVVSPYRYTAYNLGFSQSYELPPTPATFKPTMTGCVQKIASLCDYVQTATAQQDNPNFDVTNTLSHNLNFFN